MEIDRASLDEDAYFVKLVTCWLFFSDSVMKDDKDIAQESAKRAEGNPENGDSATALSAPIAAAFDLHVQLKMAASIKHVCTFPHL